MTDLDCLSQNVSISLANFWRSLKSEIHTCSNKQSRSIKNSEIFELKVYLNKYICMKIIARCKTLYVINEVIFFPIWSNEVTIFSQDNIFLECHHILLQKNLVSLKRMKIVHIERLAKYGKTDNRAYSGRTGLSGRQCYANT